MRTELKNLLIYMTIKVAQMQGNLKELRIMIGLQKKKTIEGYKTYKLSKLKQYNQVKMRSSLFEHFATAFVLKQHVSHTL